MTRRRLLVAGALLSSALTGCVGPAPTVESYEAKAATTAEAAVSALATARTAARAAGDGRLPQAYLETVLADAEESFSSIEQTFGSIQPPDDPAADRLRAELDGLLSDGGDGLSRMRIVSRRQQPTQLAAASAGLEETVAGLERFEQEHSR